MMKITILFPLMLQKIVSLKHIEYKYGDILVLDPDGVFESKFEQKDTFMYSENADIYFRQYPMINLNFSLNCDIANFYDIKLESPLDKNNKTSFSCIDLEKGMLATYYLNENRIMNYGENLYLGPIKYDNITIIQNDYGMRILLQTNNGTNNQPENPKNISFSISLLTTANEKIILSNNISSSIENKQIFDYSRQKKLIKLEIDGDAFIIFNDLKYEDINVRRKNRKINTKIFYALISKKSELVNWGLLELSTLNTLNPFLVSIEDTVVMKSNIVFATNLKNDKKTYIFRCDYSIEKNSMLKIQKCKDIKIIDDEKISKVRLFNIEQKLFVAIVSIEEQYVKLFELNIKTRTLVLKTKSSIVTKIGNEELSISFPFYSRKKLLLIFYFKNESRAPIYSICLRLDNQLDYNFVTYQLNIDRFLGIIDNDYYISFSKGSKNINLFDRLSKRYLLIQNEKGKIKPWFSTLICKSVHLFSKMVNESRLALNSMRTSFDSVKILNSFNTFKAYKGYYQLLPIDSSSFQGSDIRIELANPRSDFEFILEKSNLVNYSIQSFNDIDDYFPLFNAVIGVTNNLGFSIFDCLKSINRTKSGGFGKKMTEAKFEINCKFRKKFELKGYIVRKVKEENDWYALLANNQVNTTYKIMHIRKSDLKLFSTKRALEVEVFKFRQVRDSIYHFYYNKGSLKIFVTTGNFDIDKRVEFTDNQCVKNFSVYLLNQNTITDTLILEIFRNCLTNGKIGIETIVIKEKKIISKNNFLRFNNAEIQTDYEACLKENLKIIYKKNSWTIFGISKKNRLSRLDLDVDYFKPLKIKQVINYEGTDYFSIVYRSNSSISSTIVTYNSRNFSNINSRIFDIFVIEEVPNYLSSSIIDEHLAVLEIKELHKKYFRLLNFKGPIGYFKSKFSKKSTKEFIAFSVKNSVNSSLNFAANFELLESNISEINANLNKDLKIEKAIFSFESIFKNVTGNIIDVLINQKSQRFKVLKKRANITDLNYKVYEDYSDLCLSKYRYFEKSLFMVFLCKKDQIIYYSILKDTFSSVWLRGSIQGDFDKFSFCLFGNNIYLALKSKRLNHHELKIIKLSKIGKPSVFVSENSQLEISSTKLSRVNLEALEINKDSNFTSASFILIAQIQSGDSIIYELKINELEKKIKVFEKLKMKQSIMTHSFTTRNAIFIISVAKNNRKKIIITGLTKKGVLINEFIEKKFDFFLSRTITKIDCQSILDSNEIFCLALSSSGEIVSRNLTINLSESEIKQSASLQEYYEIGSQVAKVAQIKQGQNFFATIMSEAKFGYNYTIAIYKKSKVLKSYVYTGCEVKGEVLINFERVDIDFVKNKKNSDLKEYLLYRDYGTNNLKINTIQEFELETTAKKYTDIDKYDKIIIKNFEDKAEFTLRTLFERQNKKNIDNEKDTKIKSLFRQLIDKIGIVSTILIGVILALIFTILILFFYNRIQKKRYIPSMDNQKNLVYNLEEFQMDSARY